MNKLLVQITVDELAEIVRSEVKAALAQQNPDRGLDPVLTSEEASVFLKTPITVLRAQARAGTVPSFKVGALTRFRVSELNEYLKQLPRTKKAV